MLKVVSQLKSPLKGSITIPADKSISHRAVMFSALAKGKSIIKNFSNGADCHSTLNLFKNLGIKAEFVDKSTLTIEGGRFISSAGPLYCGNSGTTMRLVSGILAGQKFDSILTGDASLSKRPMRRIIEPLELMGAEINSEEGHAPLSIKGSTLYGITYNSPIASAQVKSAILLAGLNAKGKTTFIEPYPSRDHTERMLKYLNAEIDGTTIYPSELIAKAIEVVGDISSAAFFLVAGLIIRNSDFVLKNVGINPTRTGILDVITKMGGNISIINQHEVSGEPCADIRVFYTENLRGCIISGSDIPKLIDELPIIAILASQAQGETIVKDAGDLRNKESDRISCLVSELVKIGVDIEEREDGFVIRKSVLKGGAELECYHDHRLAMSFYVAGLLCENEIGINGFEWTKISFPDFENLFENLISMLYN